MKKFGLALVLFVAPALLLASADHILISEIVLQPSSSSTSHAEYVKLYNPTDNPVDLTNYYLTDASDTANHKYYYRLPDSANFWSGGGSDFIARFPQGFSIAAKSEVTIATGTTTAYQNFYGSAPDLSIKDDFLQAISGQTTKGTAPYYLDNSKETLALFYWDGTSATVKDVDYALWGDLSGAVDKSGVSGYLSDTPVSQQKFMTTHVDGQKLQRIGDEGNEPSSNGNGITGHDETGEDLSATWHVVSVGFTKPKLASISHYPVNPTTKDSIRVNVDVTDDTTIVSVQLIYIIDHNQQTATMNLTTGNTYSVTLPPVSTPDTLYYQVQAEDKTGLISTSNLVAVVIKSPPEALTIAKVRENWSQYKGTSVTLRGVVTIGKDILRTNQISGYFQDYTGKGLNLYETVNASVTLNRGDSIEVTGELDEYNGVYELKNWASSLQTFATGVPISGVTEVLISDIVNDPTKWEGSLVLIKGEVVERADNIGGGSNVTVEDVTGRITVRIWNTTNALFNSLGILVNTRTDSLLTVGNRVNIKCIGSVYSSAAQVLLGYADDVSPYSEGEPGAEKTKLKISPYPFVPQLGEVLKYSYEYPSNCRVILRVYDLAGRYVTTLADDYKAISWHLDGKWDGRNEFNDLAAPGTYLFILETTHKTTGKTTTKVAPAVIGVKLK
ncbi:MAG: lamin tail domain-containing protein [Candidatus Neomarinimicrobiota bacterium]